MNPLHTITPNCFRIRFYNFISSVFESLTWPVTTSSAMPVASLKYILFPFHSLALKCNHYYIHIKATCLHNVALYIFVSRNGHGEESKHFTDNTNLLGVFI